MDRTAITDSSPLSSYCLTINDSPVKPDVLRFRGTECLSRPFSWRIEFTTLQQVQGQDVLLKYASFHMRDCKVVHGIITGLEWLSTSADQSHYAVTLESRLGLLSRSRRCAIYQALSVPEVVEQVLRSHGLEGTDFEFTLSRVYPVRELITQWRETDLEFIQRILSEVGIWFRQEMNDVTELDVTVFGDSQLHYIFNGALPYHEPSGLYDGAELCCWGVRTWHNVVTAKVSTGDYNHRTALEPMDATVSVRSPAVSTGEHYRYAEPYLKAGDDTDPEPETESGAFYARIRHERELNKSAYLHLFSNAYWLSPGMVIDPVGANLRDLQDGVIIAFASYRGSRDSRLHVSVWGMPYREEYCFRPAEISRPEIHGTIPGRVESREKHDPYAHLDASGRYRVRIDFNLEECEPGFAYPWLRMMKPFAGDEYGWHMPLVDGAEVGVAFHDGNPDRPYIANAFHDSEHADIVTRDNRSQNILRTAGGNELRMKDLRGEEHIALTTPYGASQLNQGHITDEQGKQRGSGFELRTDEHGVIRVAKGLFVTADGQTKAAGEVLDMDTALREIEICQNQLQALAAAAEQAQALEADIASQIAMFNKRLKPLNGMIHFHGPEGVAFTSGEHMQLAAAENIAVNAGGDISTGSMGNTTIMVGEKIGLFARTGKLSVIASEGPVEVQAQNGEMHLSAEQKLSITAMGDILFAGKKRVTLIGGGSYLRIEEGKIEYGTDTTYTRKIKRTHLTAPATMAVKMPVMPIAEGYSEFFTLRDQKTNEPLAGFPYTLSFSGTTLSGKTSDNGQTQRAWTHQSEKIELTPHPEQFRRELFCGSYWDASTSLPLDFSDNDKEES
ncbi:type VI secretion system Vgr family protein [Citrobacter tructae]|uniref:Type VI secretion system tip protein VgrG n=1 Tax=Citrobacter tructae TaxID=2562449 RepID=A0ABX5TB13_9ENTR|nr:type VI secretion system Vgr family protein [Citrobacter tructae]QBX83323.1 type VI secretion system tip protein VgrG [Citrobacter tructae]